MREGEEGQGGGGGRRLLGGDGGLDAGGDGVDAGGHAHVVEGLVLLPDRVLRVDAGGLGVPLGDALEPQASLHSRLFESGFGHRLALGLLRLLIFLALLGIPSQVLGRKAEVEEVFWNPAWSLCLLWNSNEQ